jgi:peptidyl-prolyl cis-trans isomerase B (cyclophilin B)
VPTNQQRRATAKRKLQRQLERREVRARKRRLWTIAGLSMLAVVVVAGVVACVFMTSKNSGTKSTAASTTAPPTTSAQDTPAGLLPPFHPPADLGANCTYPATQDPAAKKVNPPRTGKVPTDPAQVSVSMMTDQGPIGIQLDNEKSPCTVNSFVSLAQQGYFDNTPCHRLTTSPDLSVLQCGDPTGSGQGGPGYQFANEYPTNQYKPDDPAAQQPIVYPRGTLAMANAGPGTNGSQFFLVYKDSQLPPQYTVFGTIDQTGLATLDKIAKAGVAGGGSDGGPATPVKITSVRMD